MQGFLDSLIGSAGAVLLFGIAWLMRKHHRHMPRWAPSWLPEALLTGAIVLALLGGAEMAFAGAGSWVITALTWVKGLLGTAGPTIFALVALGILLIVVLAVIGDASEKAVTMAFVLPLVAATFSFGFFHSFDAHLAPMAQQLTAQISQALGVG